MITTDDIKVPHVDAKNKYDEEVWRCAICDEELTFSYKTMIDPELHTLTECLAKLLKPLRGKTA